MRSLMNIRMRRLAGLLDEAQENELLGLMTENKLYGGNVLDMAMKRMDDNSEEVQNMLAIAGLFRDVFGDIQQLTSREELEEVFGNWYEKTVQGMLKTEAFVENPELAKRYLDAYVQNIKSLGGKASRFSLKKIESGLVDIVNNNKWIEQDSFAGNNSIYSPHDEDIIDDNDDILVLNAPNKARCVLYGQGESWCIGKSDLNYYNTYRLSYGATPYYVLQKKLPKDHNDHKLVVMNYGNRGYAIADRGNSERHGGAEQAGPWSQVEAAVPALRGKEQLFPYRKVTDEEIRYSKVLKSAASFSQSDLQGHIDQLTVGLVVNGAQVTAEDFIRDLAVETKFNDEQIKSLRDSLKDSLIESGYFIANKSYFLNPKQLRRNAILKIGQNERLYGDELLSLPPESQATHIAGLDTYGIRTLLVSAPNPQGVVDVLLANPQLVAGLDADGIRTLLWHAPNPQGVVDVLGDKAENFMLGLDEYGIMTLIGYAPNPQGVVDVLGDKAENFMLGLDAYGIRNLLMLSKNKDAVRVILAKLRPDLINEQAKKRLISEIRREIRKALKNNKI